MPSTAVLKSPRPARRTQAERRAESERSLLQATISLLIEKGVGAVTFDEVGRAGGFSRGLASQRFGSKQGLIDAVLVRLHDRQQSRLAEIGIDYMPGFEAVLTYVDFCLRNLSAEGEGQAYFRLLSSAVAEASELRAAFTATHTGVEQMITAWVLKGQTEGDIRPEIDADAAATMVGCLLFGLSMQLLIDPATEVEPIRRTSLAMLRASFGVTASAE